MSRHSGATPWREGGGCTDGSICRRLRRRVERGRPRGSGCSEQGAEPPRELRRRDGGDPRRAGTTSRGICSTRPMRDRHSVGDERRDGHRRQLRPRGDGLSVGQGVRRAVGRSRDYSLTGRQHRIAGRRRVHGPRAPGDEPARGWTPCSTRRSSWAETPPSRPGPRDNPSTRRPTRRCVPSSSATPGRAACLPACRCRVVRFARTMTPMREVYGRTLTARRIMTGATLAYRVGSPLRQRAAEELSRQRVGRSGHPLRSRPGPLTPVATPAVRSSHPSPWRQATERTATTGIARKIPATPPSSRPASTARMTASGCRRRPRPTRRG